MPRSRGPLSQDELVEEILRLEFDAAEKPKQPRSRIRSHSGSMVLIAAPFASPLNLCGRFSPALAIGAGDGEIGQHE
ncbi:MAG: hypothetical protein C0485_04290 [Pirellula sp.]|nr:hypothetical protein [Pirellula sp.]